MNQELEQVQPEYRNAWKQYPLRTSMKFILSHLRLMHPNFTNVVIFDKKRNFLIYADLKTSLGLGLYRYGHWDSDLDILQNQLRPGDIFIDGGANVGLFSLTAAAAVTKTGKVYAFEPADSTYKKLKLNCLLNNFNWIFIEKKAIANFNGQTDFTIFDGNSTGVSSFAPESVIGGKTQSVETIQLDDAIPHTDWPRIKLIKLDLEGAEVKALKGMSQILKEFHPDLLIEVENAHLLRQNSSAEELFLILKSYGYQQKKTSKHSPNYYFSYQEST